MNTINEEIYSLGSQIGLGKKDIDGIIKSTSPMNELVSQISGPPPYMCTLYGAISIKIF